MVFLPNASINMMRSDGTRVPGYWDRPVQWIDSPLEEDSGMVEIMSGSSSAMAPLITKKLMDWPDADEYQKSDLVFLNQLWGQYNYPKITPGPWHVLRALRPSGFFRQTQVRLARVDFNVQNAIWYQHIDPTMPDIFKTASWEPTLNQLLSTADGSFGIGYARQYQGNTYFGYLPGRKVSIGINEYSEETTVNDIGVVDYEHPVIIYEQPLSFTKWDIIELEDGRRLVITDLQHRFQRMGVVIAILQMTEARKPGDIVYSVDPPANDVVMPPMPYTEEWYNAGNA